MRVATGSKRRAKFLVWIFYSFISFFSDTQRLQLSNQQINFTYVHESNHENTA